MSSNKFSADDFRASVPSERLPTFRGRKFAFLNPHVDTATNPTLNCLLAGMTTMGAKVDLFAPRSGFYPDPAAKWSQLPFPRAFKLWYGGIRRTLTGWRDWLWGLRQARPILLGSGYDLIVGIDSEGVIQGADYARRIGSSLVYISFEIIFREELITKADQDEKTLEITASQLSDLIIVQDEARGKLLAKENGVSLDRLAYLPVAPSGPAVSKKETYLRDRFDIPHDKTIVLHAGSFTRWTFAREVLEGFHRWPKEFVLVIHSRSRPKSTDDCIRAARRAGSTRLILSTDPIDLDDLGLVFGSADVGLVLYKSTPSGDKYLQRNIRHIGLSSGKFAFCAKYGLPVLTIDQPTYADLLKEYNFGENLDTVAQIPEALPRILKSREHHSSEARRLFTERLDFERYWPQLATRLESLARGGRR